MEKNQLIMDRALRLTAFDKETGEAKFMLCEVEDFQTSVTVDNEKTITSASGATVAQIEEGKSAEISGSASFINFGLLAAQNGTEAKEGAKGTPIITPRYEVVTVGADKKAKLSKEPVGIAGSEIGYIYELLADGTLGAKHAQAVDATATEFAYKKEVDTPTITFHTEAKEGTNYAVFYEYNGEKTILLENNAEDFAGSYLIKADVLCREICNQDNVTVVTIQADNAKLSSAYDITWASDNKHPFTFSVSAKYCDTNKNLLKTYIQED